MNFKKINNYKSDRKKLVKGNIDGKKYFLDVEVFDGKGFTIPESAIDACLESGVDEVIITDPVKLKRWVFPFERISKSWAVLNFGGSAHVWFPCSAGRFVDMKEGY